MTQSASKPTQRPRYWLLTAPRTASNLLVKILNLDAQNVRPAHNGGYFFLPSVGPRLISHAKPVIDWTEEDRSQMEKVHQECFDALQDHIAAAEEEGQTVFVKEHAVMLDSYIIESQYMYGPEGVGGSSPEILAMRGVSNPTRSPLNLTCLPDEFLQTWSPTFLIRHPAMMLPSLYRTAISDLGTETFGRPNNEPLKIETTLKWSRALYDFYVSYFGEGSSWPVVLDADDIMTNPDVVAKYAKLVGFDPNKLCFSWNKASEEKLKQTSTIEKRMLSTLYSSSKIDTGKVAGSIDIDQEAVKWRSEFGEEAGKKMEKWVRDAMPDYEFMHAKRLT